MAFQRLRRPDQPGQRALVATIVVVALILLVAPLLLRPTLEITTSPTGVVDIGDARIEVTVADTPLRQAYGLQGRAGLEDGRGMLFVIDPARPVTFRRKSVPFGLEVVFVSPAGRVTGVARLDGAHETAASPGAIAHAVEVPAGWTDRHGVSVGDTVTVGPWGAARRAAPRAGATSFPGP